VGDPAALLHALAAGDTTAIAASLGNDLQPAALTLAPNLAATLEASRDVGGVLGGLVSGSGPTCAFLCEDAAAASRLAAVLPAVAGCAAARTATGPSAGARTVTV
jgi:4-diphosphocytidyl-2-C-methyl-D-erythritol kinase